MVKNWGNSTDIPVPADFDGDGRADIAVYRGSERNWYVIESTTDTPSIRQLSQPGVPVPSAYLP